MLAVVAVAQFMVVLGASVVSVAHPEVQRDLGYPQQSLSLILDAYTLIFRYFLLLGGRASDRLGRRRLRVEGITLLPAASLIRGLAQSADLLLVSRGAQGLGGAMVSPAAPDQEPRRRGRLFLERGAQRVHRREQPVLAERVGHEPEVAIPVGSARVDGIHDHGEARRCCRLQAAPDRVDEQEAAEPASLVILVDGEATEERRGHLAIWNASTQQVGERPSLDRQSGQRVVPDDAGVVGPGWHDEDRSQVATDVLARLLAQVCVQRRLAAAERRPVVFAPQRFGEEWRLRQAGRARALPVVVR